MINLHSILGVTSNSEALKTFLEHLSNSSSNGSSTMGHVPIIKSYSDGTTFHTYSELGIDLEFRTSPNPGVENELQLIAIDLENHERNDDEVIRIDKTDGPSQLRKHQPMSLKAKLGPFRAYPILIDRTLTSPTQPDSQQFKPIPLHITPQTTGLDFLQSLGEPNRKGGQDILKSGSGIWLEWTWDNPLNKPSKYGLFVQWRGEASVGPGKWEKGKDRKWGTIKIFVDL